MHTTYLSAGAACINKNTLLHKTSSTCADRFRDLTPRCIFPARNQTYTMAAKVEMNGGGKVSALDGAAPDSTGEPQCAILSPNTKLQTGCS